MSKNLSTKDWVKVIKIYKKKGLCEAVDIYCKIIGFQTKWKFGIKELRRRIRNKSFLLDNNGMKSLKRKLGLGRPKKINKRDDSDIPSIIEDLNKEQLKEIAELWIKEQRDKKEKGDKNKIVQSNLCQYH